MSELSFSAGSEIDISDVNRLEEILIEMQGQDEITISLEATDAHETDIIMDLLEKHGLDYQAKGSHDGKHYYITARPFIH